VSSTEYLGADTIVTVATPAGDRIAVRHAGVAKARQGDSIAAVWDAAHERVFDAATERYAGPGAAGPDGRATAH
jgi:hypothetical protein